MKVYKSLRSLQGKFKRPVITLGVYDAIHKAHSRILKETVRIARKKGRQSIVITFDPHPRGAETLYNLKQRLELLGNYGLDACIVLKFNKALSGMRPGDFVKNILVKKLDAGYVCVGRDFRFGKNASGDTPLLKELSRSYGFKLKIFTMQKTGNRDISSTYIRNLLKKGKVAEANRILVRPFFLDGVVSEGDSIGRSLGFPTANIISQQNCLLPDGVYAVRIIFDSRLHYGVCYIGKRPTIKRERKFTRIEFAQNNSKRNTEVYIFDFSKNIYAKRVRVEFISYLRPEKVFPSLPGLAKGIKKDVLAVKAVIPRH